MNLAATYTIPTNFFMYIYVLHKTPNMFHSFVLHSYYFIANFHVSKFARHYIITCYYCEMYTFIINYNKTRNAISIH